MNKDTAIKILRSRRSGKDQLREALAWALGEPAPKPPKRGDEEASVFTTCKNIFSQEYGRVSGVAYNFGIKDGVALSGIIKKIETLDENNVPAMFTAFVQNLPEWYKKNAFSLPVINSKFNEIAASISKKAGSTNGNSAAREAVRAAFSGDGKS